MLKKVLFVAIAAGVGFGLFAGSQALSQDNEGAKGNDQKNGEQGQGGAEMAKMMAAYAQAGAVTDKHKEMAKSVGTWKTVSKMWMNPGQPMVMDGVSEIKTIMGGRFIQEDFHCTSPAFPFVGRLVMGYNNTTKEYISIWIDDQSTGVGIMRGHYDEKAKELHLTGETVDPIRGKMKVRAVSKCVNDDKTVFTMYDQAPGKPEYKSMEITYTRVTDN